MLAASHAPMLTWGAGAQSSLLRGVRCIVNREQGAIVQDFIPRFEVATLRPPQTRLIPKLGGLPWGFPVDMWPRCPDCSIPMALLAQLPHDGPALDLGDARWVLHVFQCATAGCFTWDYDGGCNAAFILPREVLREGLTQAPPASTDRPVRAWIGEITAEERSMLASEERSMHGELWITGWQEHEDTIPHDMRPAYFDFDAFWTLPDKLRSPHDHDHRFFTKAGGVPYWTVNGPSGFPPAPFDYLMQIDTHLYIRGHLPDPSTIGCDVWANGEMEARPVPSAAERKNAPWGVAQASDRDDEYYVEFANFGSDGTAYVFIDRETTPPLVMFFWNR